MIRKTEATEPGAIDVAAHAFTRTCVECGRVFDLLTAAGAEEFCFGHDCEDAYHGAEHEHDARPAAAQVLCALHGWEPEDADCSAAATEWRLA